MNLIEKLEEVSRLRKESFTLMLDKTREYPINLNAIRELSDTHSNYCTEYKRVIMNYEI